jgi:diguanylate cyclase (GGDEF)-like protein
MAVTNAIYGENTPGNRETRDETAAALEQRRLEALHRYEALDTPPKEGFDRVTTLAAEVFDVPIALVNLVSKDRQFSKSCYGIDVRNVDRQVSFCTHTIQSDDVMVVLDTKTDPRFVDNPYVLGDPRIRFYAGAPLRAPSGENIGALCIIDEEPRFEFTQRDRMVLDLMARMVIDEFELRLANRRVHEELARRQELERDNARLIRELEQKANFDSLTGLANRSLMGDRLNMALAEAKRANSSVSVILMDLDNFKAVSDTFGHSAGDRLLQTITGALEQALRGVDTIARLGGDEFVLIVPLQQDNDYCTDIAERVLGALQRQVRIVEHEVTARPSIGISMYPQDGRTPEALLQAADTAMYAAKHAGKNQYRFFAESMNRQVSERLQIESELQDALYHDQLELHYQPRVRLDSGAIIGAEGLLRWRHPRRGLLLPKEFIGVAERGPLISEIDRLVLGHAARRLATWQSEGRNLLLSVNLSARELHSDGFAADVARILEYFGVNPSGLELEITESMLMQDFGRASRQLLDLKERAPGLRIAIDDFGSGYSSLNYLRHLPVDTLKIDRSFVVELEESDDDTAAAIAKTIVGLAHNLRMTVVAEGVEHVQQLRLLRGFGCEQAQGFLFDRALPCYEFEERLTSGGGYTVAGGNGN